MYQFVLFKTLKLFSLFHWLNFPIYVYIQLQNQIEFTVKAHKICVQKKNEQKIRPVHAFQ